MEEIEGENGNSVDEQEELQELLVILKSGRTLAYAVKLGTSENRKFLVGSQAGQVPDQENSLLVENIRRNVKISRKKYHLSCELSYILVSEHPSFAYF